MLKNYRYAWLAGMLLLSIPSFSQDLDSLLNLNAFTEESDLQKILNKNVAVSSKNGLTTRETPGIITVITSEEIQNSGARDMIDVLRLVPGFDVQQDLQFVMGIGLRGSWANEGKVLVMLDGQPFNELLYQTVAIGNRFPVDAVERIEIIRGPGSAIYGGSAEYGVINIITKAAESLDGVAVYGVGGFHANAIGRTNAGVMAARKSEIFSWDLSAFKGNGIVSDGQYQDLFQSNDVQDLKKVTRADPMNLNLGLKYKNLAFRTMYDQFETSDPVTYVSNKNFYADLRYAWKVNSKLQITPQLKYYNQVPWTYGPMGTDEKQFHVRAKRSLAQVDAQYDFSRKASVTFGGLYFQDEGIDLLDGGLFQGNKSLTLNNFAFFAQGLFKHRLANATLGFRYEKNNRYGAAFVPRIALTKKIENLHFKILYSQAFRAPSIQNINIALNGQIKPEKSNVFEVELGYQFTPEMLLAVNAFSISTKNILVYSSEGEGETFNEWYENSAKSGSRGVEMVYSIRKKTWYANLTYSFSAAINDNTALTYAVPGQSQYVGFAKNKVTLNTNVYLTPKLSFNPTFIYASKRFAYTTLDDEGNPALTTLDPYVLVNAFLNYKNIFPGFTLGAGAYDITNTRPAIPEAYNGGYAPIPGRSREYVVKISYQINFKK
ncbi:TonB-dependent receptor plug domain-containing protein [Chryseolinea lacunae]|uniref:TonB-dependent receptor plug domain-containing protein n=1 Tax=Chryseolinea lacunae TaxID=2801331 RepID=A0ABS1KVB8_9BACT|nr:TonB-dependent receptor plug domain-containing protein [Chryseolinea lacunae]MBL0743258.1 TonB-dependent receptor plug domain-containing protein [Chryseolinea lacunae]